MKKFILAGASLNSGNRGVNALTRGQINIILEKYEDSANIEILSYTVSKVTKNRISVNKKSFDIYEYPVNKRQLLKSYMKLLVGIHDTLSKKVIEADCILDISEGDSFSDIYGWRRFLNHCIIKMISIKVKTKLLIMPQTIGPFENKIVRHFAKYTLKNADIVFTRDTMSKKYIYNNLKLRREVILAPDIAFYLETNEDICIERFITKKEATIVGLNVSALLYNGGYTGNNMFGLKVNYKEMIHRIILEVSSIPNVRIILIPHVMVENVVVEDDFRVCKEISHYIKQEYDIKALTIDKYYKEDEIKGVISGCDFFVGSRMHSCIAAVSNHIPTAPIAYSRKFIGIWDDLGLGHCVLNPINCDEDVIIANLIGIFNDRLKIKEQLDQVIPRQMKQLQMIKEYI